MKKLQNMRSPMASVLERRVVLMEMIQVLMWRKVKSISRHDLVTYLNFMDENKVNLPYRIRCDIFEVQIANLCGDFLTSESGSAADIAERFNYWVPPVGEVKESRLTMTHILSAEDDRHKRLKLDGAITEEQEEEMKQQVSEASLLINGELMGF